VGGVEELLLLLLLDLDEFDRRGEQPVVKTVIFLSFSREEGRDVRRGKTTACTCYKDLAERGFSLLILGIIGVLHLELHKEAVRREKHPVQKRGGGLFRGNGSVVNPVTLKQRGVGGLFGLKEG
jgi:hypothetical protein